MFQVLVCEGCGGSSTDLLDALARQDVSALATGCLGVCADPVTVAVQAAGRATYVFSGLGVEDAGDIAAFVAAYLAADAGWIEDARPLGRLRHCLVTRVPALI